MFFKRLSHPHPPPRRQRQGFGLLEVILVFALVIGASAVVFSVFYSARNTSDVSNEASRLALIAANLRSAYENNHTFASVSNANGIKAKVFPATMVNGSTVSSSWGPINLKPLSSSALKGSCGVSMRCYYLTYTNVPSAACVKLVAATFSMFPDAIYIGPNTNKSFHVGDGAPLDMAAVAGPTACGSADPVQLSFVGK